MNNKSRGILIAGNWKMNYAPQATRSFFCELAQGPAAGLGSFKTKTLHTCIAAPSVSLVAALEATSRFPFPVSIASQNTHWEKKGAFTGEVSGPMLKEIGVSWSLVAHSERRQFFGETDETARKRSESLLAQEFQVIFCVGESRAEREAGQTNTVLTRQLQAIVAIHGHLIIAYEPVWAIGTGLTATPDQAEEVHRFIRKNLWDRFGMDAAGRTSILYGGSVTPENAESLLVCPNVDGALVGGASLTADGFSKILSAADRILSL